MDLLSHEVFDLIVKYLSEYGIKINEQSIGGVALSAFFYILSRAIPTLIKDPTILKRWYARLKGDESKEMLLYLRSMQSVYKPDLHGIMDKNMSDDVFIVVDLGEGKGLKELSKKVDFNELPNMLRELKEKGHFFRPLAIQDVEINDSIIKKAKFFLVSLYVFPIYKKHKVTNKPTKEITAIYIMGFTKRGLDMTSKEKEEILKGINKYKYNFKIN